MQAACCCEKKSAVEAPSYASSIWETLKSEKAYEVATLVVRAVIGVFGLIMSPITFGVAFGVGAVGGALYYHHNRVILEALETQPVCARGYAELLGQAKFPSIVNLGITTITLAACISCHTAFYAPFSGFFVGFYVGQKGAERAFSAHSQPVLEVKPFKVDLNIV